MEHLQRSLSFGVGDRNPRKACRHEILLRTHGSGTGPRACSSQRMATVSLQRGCQVSSYTDVGVGPLGRSCLVCGTDSSGVCSQPGLSPWGGGGEKREMVAWLDIKKVARHVFHQQRPKGLTAVRNKGRWCGAPDSWQCIIKAWLSVGLPWPTKGWGNWDATLGKEEVIRWSEHFLINVLSKLLNLAKFLVGLDIQLQ